MRKIIRTGVALCLGFLVLGAPLEDAFARHRHYHHIRHYHHHTHHHKRHYPDIAKVQPIFKLPFFGKPANPEDPIEKIISDAAMANGVPTRFALAIAKKESGFRPNVTNGGAIGLFQMKCATAKGIGYKGSCAALRDPKVNAAWGTLHLKLAMQTCHGNLAGAAKLHNAGLGASCRSSSYSRSIMSSLR